MGMDLIKKILVKDVDKRLGHGPDGYKHIKGHAFFRYIDWEKELTLPLVLKGAGPTSQTGAKDEMFKPSKDVGKRRRAEGESAAVGSGGKEGLFRKLQGPKPDSLLDS